MMEMRIGESMPTNEIFDNPLDFVHCPPTCTEFAVRWDSV